MKLTDFLTETGRPVTYFPKLCPLLGGVVPTVFLCQFVYWRGKEASSIGEVYKTKEEITAETGLIRSEQDTARKHLRRLGLLTERHARLEHRMYYTIHLDRLNALWDDYITTRNIPKLEPDAPEVGSSFRQEAIQLPSSSESTSETTTEITHKGRHKGVFAEKPRKHALAHGHNEPTGYLLSKYDGYLDASKTDNLRHYDDITATLIHYYEWYLDEMCQRHPPLKQAQLRTIYATLDAFFATHALDGVSMVDHYFQRGLGRADGNINAFATEGMLEQLAREIEPDFD